MIRTTILESFWCWAPSN